MALLCSVIILISHPVIIDFQITTYKHSNYLQYIAGLYAALKICPVVAQSHSVTALGYKVYQEQTRYKESIGTFNAGNKQSTNTSLGYFYDYSIFNM